MNLNIWNLTKWNLNRWDFKTWSGAFQASSLSTCLLRCGHCEEKIGKVIEENILEVVTQLECYDKKQDKGRKEIQKKITKKSKKIHREIQEMSPGKRGVKREVCSLTEDALQVAVGETFKGEK